MAFLNIGQKIEKVMGKEQELLDAARTGNVHTVDKLLSNKPRKSTGGGVLSHRLTSGLTSFLHQSVNVNCTDKNGYTPLHHATVNGHRDVVERLLKSDAEPGLTDHQGCTPCHLAAWHGDAEICLQLLNAGTEEPPEGAPEITPVQVNQQNISGETALHSAAQYGHVAVVDVLLQKHANPNIRNLHEESPLDLAAQYGRKEVVQLLLIKFPDLVHRPLYNCSPLHLASRNGHRDIVDVLLFNGFNIHTLTDMGTALHEAALYGKLDVVKVLLERGINVHIKDQSGLTAFDLVDAHKAKQQSYTEIKTAITEHIEKLKYSKFDTGENESLSKQPEEKPGNDEEKSPDRPVPKPRPRTYVLESPTTDTAKDLYSTPQKEKKDDIDRATSSASSVSENLSPPPLPPRTSIFPPEDRSTVIIPPESLTPTESMEESKTPPLGSKHVVMPKPRKPPRQKKPSPVPPRKTATESEESSDTSIQSLDSSPLTHPKPVSPKVPPRPLSVRKPPAIPSAITDSQDQKKENIPNSSSVITDQSHSSKSESDQSKSLLLGSKDELPATTSKENSGSPVSPASGLPPKPCEPTIDTSVDPMFGTPVHQNLYMEMTASVTKEPEDKTAPKQSDVNSDSYGMLFPKYKNTKGSSLKASPLKVKRAEFRRTNTAPDENIYVGPSSPESPLAKFKEKQGLLRRANTQPDENMYITVTEKVLTRQGRIETENEYSEIAEQKSPNSPQSPTENIYAVIAEKTDSNIYGHLADASSGGTVESKEDNSNLSDKTHSESTGADRSKSENVPAGGKPNYLDFVARKSLAQEPLTPTGYTQPPTPDFPPPSPATAMIGIELKIQEMEDVIEV